MRTLRVVLTVVAVFVAGPPSVSGQEAPTLMVVEDRHFKASMVSQLEEALKEAVAFFSENDFPFAESRFVSDRDVLRTVTPMATLEDLDVRRRWFGRLSSPPAFVGDLQEATEYIDRSIYRARPELSYRPDNLRVPLGETGFFLEIRAFLRPGAEGEAAEILGKMAALRKRHALEDPTVVWFQEMGSDGPRFSVFFPAKDPASFYTHGDRNIEQLGEEQQTLAREFRALCRRVENVHWTIRRDLNYMPTN